MKILTMAAPRSGGLYFTKSLADTYGLTHCHEPSIDTLNRVMDRYKNISIKLHAEQFYKHYELNLKLDIDSAVDAIYNDLHKYNFNHIFILDRRNKIEHAEAMINIFYHKKNMKAKWSADDEEFLKIKNSEKWNLMLDYSNAVSIWLDKLSIKFDIPKIYYEDLYYNTNTVNLYGLKFKPDITKKLRGDNPPIII